MFDKERLKEFLADYRRDLVRKRWNSEKYKWEAVKWFRDNWDVNAPDFVEMLERSLDKTFNLLASNNNFPKGMIVGFARSAPEEVRSMFISLFDEEKDVYERVDAFKTRSSVLLEKYGNGAAQHYQYENAISTYLWLRYPDKYYIYQFVIAKTAADKLKSDHQFRKGHFADNFRSFMKLYDEICGALKEDTELINIFRSQLTETCYPDPELKALTIDVCFYISRDHEQEVPLSDAYGNENEISDKTDTVCTEEHDDGNGIEKYTKTDFLNEVYMSEKSYNDLTAVLKNKKNIILQGAPGVGKTFTAKRLAYSVMGEKDESRTEFIQFHQNYSYEDLMMGYKPVGNGFELKYGIFYRFCMKAAERPDKDHFFIIDEINRGNMSKVFGELLMLIEKDHRGTTATLAYNGLPFSVPKNLYIIGMMNTADRSLAMIDYALRRRFSFFELGPGFDSEGFIRYQNSLDNETFNELIAKIKELNSEISRDKSLGKGFCIGHSYFCGLDVCTEERLRSIVEYDIIPTLREYWFDDENKLMRWENILQGVFQ